jgi:hypothetical protein
LFNAFQECLELEKFTNLFNFKNNYKKSFDFKEFKYLKINKTK